MPRYLVTLACAAAVAGPAALLAAGHSPVEQREAKMKTVGESTQTVGKMVKGETEFDAAVALTALEDMRAATEGFADLYPDGTQGESSNKWLAADAVWTDREGFEATLAAFQEDLDTAIDAAPDTRQAMASQFGMVTENCKTCHEDYRLTNE